MVVRSRHDRIATSRYEDIDSESHCIAGYVAQDNEHDAVHRSDEEHWFLKQVFELLEISILLPRMVWIVAYVVLLTTTPWRRDSLSNAIFKDLTMRKG